MAELERFFKEAWSRALTGVGAAEQEAEKVLGRMTGMSGDELRQQAQSLMFGFQRLRWGFRYVIGARSGPNR